MPHTIHKAAFKATTGNFSLLLSAQHNLHFPVPQHDKVSGNVHAEVTAQNPLPFTLSGSKDGILATHDELVTSKTTNYLLELLRKNTFELGLDTISKIAISQLSDVPGCEFSISFANAASAENLAAIQPGLESLHLNYSWKTRPTLTCNGVTPPSDPYDDLFSKDLTLPLQTLLDDVITRFVKNSLVRRYPFVFGNLAQQFNNEAAYFQPMVTSIKRIIRRSLDPDFRSQCGQLLKILRHRYNFYPDLDYATGGYRHTTSRQPMSSEVAFYLAMRRIFKAGMKWSEFKGTHAYITDVEEHGLLETGLQEAGPSLDSVPSLPIEVLLLDEDEGEPEQDYYRDISLFEMFDFPHLNGASLPHPTTHSADEMLFDTDSEDARGSVDTNELVLYQKTGSGDISIDLDESDEDEFQESAQPRTVGSPLASYGENVFICPPSQLAKVNILGTKSSSFVKPTVRIHLEPEIENTRGLYLCSSLGAPANHNIQKARSGDTGNSQERGYEYHPAYWWTQLTPSKDLLVADSAASRASIFLGLEHLAQPFMTNEVSLLNVDMGTTPKSDDNFGLIERGESGGVVPEFIHCSPSSLDHVPHHDDVPSDGLYSDEEIDMDDHHDRDLPSEPNCIDCIIDEDMITDSPIVRNAEAPILGDEDFDLVAEGFGPGSSVDGIALCISKGEEATEGLAENDDEMGFIELIT